MTDVFLFACCFVIAFGLVSLFVLYHIYGGVNDTLACARIGAVYNFRYFQPLTGDYDRYLAKVVAIRNMTKSEIARLNWHSVYRMSDKNFHRTNTLVTCEMSNGDYRQFYAERSDMCKRPLVAGLLFKAGVAHLF